MSNLRASFYAKNLPPWERAARGAVALVGAAIALVYVSAPTRWLVVTAALSFGLTAVVGFCPMCALAGRRLAKRQS
jgi:hypothetical protein